MDIHDLAAIHLQAGSGLLRRELNGSKEVKELRAVSENRGPAKVEISEEARFLAAHERDAIEHLSELPEERVLEIHRWIGSGSFHLPTTLEEVARRILASGDLGL